jgi:hypothetical protein
MLTVQQLADRAAIEDVLMRHCRGVDRMDFDLIRSCFHADAHIRYEPLIDGDRAAYLAFLQAPAALGGLTRTMHFASTLLIQLAGDVADTELYARAHHTSGDDHPYGGAFVTTWLRYIDRFERRGGDWRIIDRYVIREWMRRDVAGMWEDVPAPGRRDRTDPSYRGAASFGPPDQIWT